VRSTLRRAIAWAIRGASALQDRRAVARPGLRPSWREREAAAVRTQRPRVAAILDEISTHCLAPELDLILLSRASWRAALDAQQPALLFVESAWNGNGGSWKGCLSRYDDCGADLRALVTEASQRGIVTVFWAKDDPPRFERFLLVARLFDYVFTTDEGCVADYCTALGHERVFVLPFAAQPALHNPVRDGAPLSGRFCFPGSWHSHVYPDRGARLAALLQPLRRTGRLDVFDRFSGVGAERGEFPRDFRSCVRPPRPYAEMAALSKRYDAVLNVNSVEHSRTMCSRRVFEVLGSGTPLISSPSRVFHAWFPGLVYISETEEQTLAAVDALTTDSHTTDRTRVRALRAVHTRHTYRHRVTEVLHRVGWPSTDPPDPLVSVIIVSNRPAFASHALANFRRQTYRRKELVFVAHGWSESDVSHLDAALASCRDARLIAAPATATVGGCTNDAIDESRGDFFAKFDDDDYYAPDYLTDAMLAFRYSDAAIVGKKTFFAYVESAASTYVRFPGHEYRYVNRVLGPTMVCDRRVLDQVRFTPLEKSGTDTRFLNDCAKKRLPIFSTDRFNFTHFRRGPEHGHLWKIEDDDFLRACVRLGDGFAEDHVTA
jgi:Glycosyl transferases group 1/Glycosyl transferase family 2/DUF based on E. rectale Gene description (DUF3880)